MKVALNPAELRLIVDALDDKRQFQLQSGRAGGAGRRGLRTLLHLQRPKRFRIMSERSTQELVPKNDCSRGGCIPFPAKREPWSCLRPVSQVSGIVSSTRAIELFGYRYNAVDDLPKS
jgi:hypothetical protein